MTGASGVARRPWIWMGTNGRWEDRLMEGRVDKQDASMDDKTDKDRIDKRMDQICES